MILQLIISLNLIENNIFSKLKIINIIISLNSILHNITRFNRFDWKFGPIILPLIIINRCDTIRNFNIIQAIFGNWRCHHLNPMINTRMMIMIMTFEITIFGIWESFGFIRNLIHYANVSTIVISNLQ